MSKSYAYLHHNDFKQQPQPQPQQQQQHHSSGSPTHPGNNMNRQSQIYVNNSSNYSRSSSVLNQIASDLMQLKQSASSRLAAQSSAGFNSSHELNPSPVVLSAIEAAILRSSVPIDIHETEEITVNGQRGIWANKIESENWRGTIPLNQYTINEDPNPDIITKRSQQQIVYQQEVAIRYLRPPTPPAPGDILIKQEANTVIPPAPPLVLRQQPARPITPAPLVVREAPPPPPPLVGKKVITISGKRIPPPPRKVVIERLPPLPSKPQSVIIERWLPYTQVKRKVIFQKANDVDPVIVKPKNVIIQWEPPQIKVNKEFKDLGVIRANPTEYVARYGTTLKPSNELPSFVLEIKPPAGMVLASDSQSSPVYELEGDLEALKLVDLDREGLSEYKPIFHRLGITNHESTDNSTSYSTSVNHITNSNIIYGASLNNSNNRSNTISKGPSPLFIGGFRSSSLANPSLANISSSSSNAVGEIFAQIDQDQNGKVSVEEAEKLLLRLNSRLGRRYGADDVTTFFNRLDTNRDGYIDLNEFRRAFENQLYFEMSDPQKFVRFGERARTSEKYIA